LHRPLNRAPRSLRALARPRCHGPVTASPRRSPLPPNGLRLSARTTPRLTLPPLYLPLSVGFFQTAPEQKSLPPQLWPPAPFSHISTSSGGHRGPSSTTSRGAPAIFSLSYLLLPWRPRPGEQQQSVDTSSSLVGIPCCCSYPSPLFPHCGCSSRHGAREAAVSHASLLSRLQFCSALAEIRKLHAACNPFDRMPQRGTTPLRAMACLCRATSPRDSARRVPVSLMHRFFSLCQLLVLTIGLKPPRAGLSSSSLPALIILCGCDLVPAARLFVGSMC
jgi:hypothetical protein